MAPPTDSISTVLAKLEELGKKFDIMDRKTDETNTKIEEMQCSVQQIKDEQTSMTTWKPELDDKVKDLQDSVYLLKKKVDLFIHESPKSATTEDDILIGVSAPAHLGASADAGTSGQNGHRLDHHHRSVGAGVVTTLAPPPVTDAGRFSNLSPVPFCGFDSIGSIQSSGLGHAIPPIEFARFDGSNPKIWINRCESYFDVYDLPSDYWVKLATINFRGSAVFWMQSIEMNLNKCDWKTLCDTITGRFERDQHNHIIRQFFHVKQTGSVIEYVEAFDELVHQLLAYDPYFSPTIVTSRFVDGLKTSIKSVVLLHRPKVLDTASSLAILQEEVLLGYPSTELKRNESVHDYKQQSKVGYSATVPKVSDCISEKKMTNQS